jgi:hypothetical protein
MRNAWKQYCAAISLERVTKATRIPSEATKGVGYFADIILCLHNEDINLSEVK